MEQFIINDIHRNSSNGTEYIKQNGVKSLQILPRFYSYGHISMPSKSIFMSLFLYISFLFQLVLSDKYTK